MTEKLFRAHDYPDSRPVARLEPHLTTRCYTGQHGQCRGTARPHGFGQTMPCSCVCHAK